MHDKNIFLPSQYGARSGIESGNWENGLERERTIDADKGYENKWMILLTVAVNGFLNILDISIVNISFPTLTRVFETEPSVILWVSLAYALVTVGLMLILGKIGDL